PTPTPFPSTTLFRSIRGAQRILGEHLEPVAALDPLEHADAPLGELLDALQVDLDGDLAATAARRRGQHPAVGRRIRLVVRRQILDRKSTRLNSSHVK